MIGPRQVIHPGFAGERHRAGESHGLHTRQLLQQRRERDRRSASLTALTLGRESPYCGAKRSTCSQCDVAGIEAAILPQQMRKTAQHQRGDDEQDDRARYL